jgi:XTP/dITP diphosphohydrolase
MDIYFATTNLGKVQYLKKDLQKHSINVIQYPIDLIEPRSSDVMDIAKSKIEQAYKEIKKPTVVIDAGFYIDELNGFPGAFVNFSLQTIGTKGILKLIENKKRGCEFRECLAYMDDKLKEPKYFTIRIRGHLADNELGVMQKHLWSELGLIFIPDESTKTLAEMTYDEYLDWKNISKEKNSLGNQLCEWIAKHEE